MKPGPLPFWRVQLHRRHLRDVLEAWQLVGRPTVSAEGSLSHMTAANPDTEVRSKT